MWARTLQVITSILRYLGTTPFLYALVITSTLVPKILHLWTHLATLHPLTFVLYLPTFLSLDVLNAVVFWGLLHVGNYRSSLMLTVVKVVLCFAILATSSMQLSFYMETGGEIKWGAAKNVATDLAGIKVLLSGSMQALLCSTIMVAVACIISHPLYKGAESLSNALTRAFTGIKQRGPIESRETIFENNRLSFESHYEDSASMVDESDDDFEKDLEASSLITQGRGTAKRYSPWKCRISCLTTFAITIFLLVIRPGGFPYAHMSGSLPFTLLEIFIPAPDICLTSDIQAPFPLPELISEKFWERPDGKSIGWMPTGNVSNYTPSSFPSWLPNAHLNGFERWHNDSEGSPQYNPVQDPMRISNLNQEVLAPITDALKDHEIAIKHVVLLALESTRKDVFPLKKGSRMHEIIMKSHGSKDKDRAEQQLAKLTLNAELLTGESGGFERQRSDGKGWRNMQDRGGLNVQGAFTGSTTSLKSMLGSHCGVQPLPVDFTLEAHKTIYQPCIPHILDLLNHNKLGRNDSSSNSTSSMPWRSAYAQSITDKFDNQDELNRHVGFSEVITKDTLVDPTSNHFPPTEKESNYFGYPEPQLKPYFMDIFQNAKIKNERVFLSHLTTSTHHPWNTPEAAGASVDYLARGLGGSEHPLNRYLNTIKYGDRWIGEIMDMLEDLGVAHETLVVMVGDHGYAFEEDSPMHSTFENGHISNMRVPLVFHHPALPRIQIAANATSMSILPTILDLLVTTSSVSSQDKDILENLVQQYEGQSLIRPFQTRKNGRQAWNVGILNAGGAVLSVSSTAVPYRLVLPICKTGIYRFTDNSRDPDELTPVEDFSIEKLAERLRGKHGDESASQWVLEAEKVGKWWVMEQRRRWQYQSGSSAQ